ncbi:hypothetical protein ACE5D9_05805 [Rickettsia sp. 2024-CO-Wats]|uniref:hypothetical protein n=1 Tax=unclassified Rickettsia TaxID=114295 RepID=UPI00370D0E21
MQNIQYYNNNAQEFYSRTINADLSDNYKAFISYLPEQVHILDVKLLLLTVQPKCLN